MSVELWFGIASIAIGFIGAMFSLLASVIAYFVKRNETLQDQHIQDLTVDVDKIKQTLASYETHIGAGDERLKEIKADINDHVVREETIFWKKVDAISEAQRIFAEAVLQRITAMEGRLPNGELKDMALAIARIEANQRLVQQQAELAMRHVEDHDAEAEDWKRRIVAVETIVNAPAKRRKISAAK